MPEYTNSKAIFHQNLIDAGCKENMVEQCMELYELKDDEKLCGQLTIHRKSLLYELHQIQYEIDCLDYLLQRLKRTENK